MMAKRVGDFRGAAPASSAVIYVGPAPLCVARVGRYPRQEIQESDAACAALLDAARPPAVCGPHMPIAPARGPMVHFTPRRMEVTDTGGVVRRHAGSDGMDAARAADVFDLMIAQAQRRHGREIRRARARGDNRLPRFAPPFTVGQVEVAREYAALTERCDAAGVKCSSMEALGAGGSGRAGDREAAIFRDLQQLRAFHVRIGDGLVKEVRRIRPGGRKRVAIRARYLVDQVCLGGLSLSEVLERNGWAVNAKSVDSLRRDLAAALDRLRGFDLARV
ncbi:MAG: hypothetical protein GYB53_15030 [Rhodobacteraceae bacterium]|nr:hypothetical protein [Paracoccaceae bacterium]MBR9823723.1 hypothetical protein [Paracoccaceae bacterium]